jgi:hypothetical protein
LKEYADYDNGLIKELIDQYIIDFPIYLKLMLSGIEMNNFKELKFIAHKMKNPVSIFGLNKTSQTIAEIESLALSLLSDIEKVNEKYEICKMNIENSFIYLTQIIY